MMERRKALTIPFTVGKDNLMEHPLRIPITCLASDCGKLEGQVSWTAFAGCKLRQHDSLHKNGSKLFDHSLAAMGRKKPRLILTDVLKTERGQAYMERIKQNKCMSSTRRESGRSREEALISRGTRSEVRTDKTKSVTPKRNQKTPSSSSQRSRVRKRLQNADDEEDEEENKDIEEVIIGNGEDYKFSEVVDCGLSVSWEPAEDTGSCDEFSPASIKDRLSDPEKEVQHSSKRKRKEASHCNGTGSPKRHRESVLRLTGEDGTGSAQMCPEESEDYGDMESLDQTIVQFTVGGDDRTEVNLSNLDAGDLIGSPGRSLSTGQDDTTKSSPPEPIVLSSDDEEGSEVPQRCSPAAHKRVTVEEKVIQRQTSQEAVAKQQKASDAADMQVLSVIIEDPPDSVPLIPSEGLSLSVSFSALHYGGYQGKANGDMMVTGEKIIIPLSDTSSQEKSQEKVMLTFQRKELRRYSVWEQHEMQVEGIYFEGDEDPCPSAVLLFCVSDTAAAGIQGELLELLVKQGSNTNTGKASPFILVTLRDPLEGMEGALLRSFLDIDCLNRLADEKSLDSQGAESITGLENIHTPVLSLDESIELIRRTGRDSSLLCLLGLESEEPDQDADQEDSHSDTDENTTPIIQVEVDSQKETEVETETAAERETRTPLKAEEDQKEQVLEPTPSEKRKEGTPPVYTLRHRRTTGSYSVSVCRPAPSWIKYKHQGLPRRLIQFPPPPLKGGITVTMEDLQCLDSGQFLNDVIIDFYLKYLLQNASEAVSERCHIFSSFFYKQLTRRDNASEGIANETCQRQRRHQRVKTWTRHVDIFKKDFLFVPVNQEAHWYLVVICFPGLEEPKLEAWNSPNSQNGKSNGGTEELQEQEVAQGGKSPNEITETPSTPNPSDNTDTGTEKAPEEPTKEPPGPVKCTEQTCQKSTVSKRPCILIMDSLKLSLHERVFKLLRDYLQSEWEVRRGSSRDFSPDQMQSSHCQVPLQDNSSDCGLYLLQYVESFLKDPVVHFDLPLHLQRWFPRQLVRRKRDEIRDLVLHLYRKQNLDGHR
uniref:sentrin-specific protease 7 isoform X2 n=1 Tax=Semicossyphus pulcher TaxID=241346 RepID=UPI0037E9901D